jgi:hypothetical protein
MYFENNCRHLMLRFLAFEGEDQHALSALSQQANIIETLDDVLGPAGGSAQLGSGPEPAEIEPFCTSATAEDN